MGTYLDGIVSWHRARAAADGRELAGLSRRATASPPTRPFRAALADRTRPGPAVIAEIKRRSPSRGDLATDLDPAALATDYEAGGAACVSVLTDGPHFAGSPDDLAAARGATSLPVLRKDFTVSEADVFDARIMGADAVLLIVAALGDDELSRFVRLASDLSLAALVEVHDASELDRALAAGADLIGVNQRDLRSFAVDPHRAESLAGLLPPGAVKVAESGVSDAAQVRRLAEVGYDAVLVGERLLTATDRVSAVRELTCCGATA